MKEPPQSQQVQPTFNRQRILISFHTRNNITYPVTYQIPDRITHVYLFLYKCDTPWCGLGFSVILSVMYHGHSAMSILSHPRCPNNMYPWHYLCLYIYKCWFAECLFQNPYLLVQVSCTKCCQNAIVRIYCIKNAFYHIWVA